MFDIMVIRKDTRHPRMKPTKCPKCKGSGKILIGFSSRPEDFIACENCNGTGFTVENVSMIGMLQTPSPQWYEMLDWDEMGDTWWEIKEEIRQKVRDSGKAPKFDRKTCPECGKPMTHCTNVDFPDKPFYFCYDCVKVVHIPRIKRLKSSIVQQLKELDKKQKRDLKHFKQAEKTKKSGILKGELGKYKCPMCGANDWEPVLWVEGEPYDECKKCGYHFTSKDIPKLIKRFDPVKDFVSTQGFRPEWRHGRVKK